MTERLELAQAGRSLRCGEDQRLGVVLDLTPLALLPPLYDAVALVELC